MRRQPPSTALTTASGSTNHKASKMTESTPLPASTTSTPSSPGAWILYIVIPTSSSAARGTTTSPPMTATARIFSTAARATTGAGAPRATTSLTANMYTGSRLNSGGAQAELERPAFQKAGKGPGGRAASALLLALIHERP